jgi:hypothetical protein
MKPPAFIATTLLMLASSVVTLDAASAATPAPPTGDWNFRALLDGKPIGEHRFHVDGSADERNVRSEAIFAVKIIGITAYHYHHLATEQWKGDCLQSMTAATDDDGKKSEVHAKADGDELVVKTGSGNETLHGCVMSFAYWNPAIQTQTRMLNAQTGKVEKVQVSRAGDGQVEVHGKSVTATRWRITGPEQPIDVWYAADGQWVGLDSTVGGKRKLSYRLE